MKSELVFFVLASLALNSAAQTVNFRLPTTVIPEHYDLNVDTNLTSFTFSGSVTIRTRIMQFTDTIVLHSKDLDIRNVSVTIANNNVYFRHDVVPATDFLRIFLLQNLTVNTLASVTIHYTGVLGTGNVGYYRASYVNELNQTRHIAITHLEATNARRAFPCFDQPNLKATFHITLTQDSQLTTASNTRIQNSILVAPNRRADSYTPTPLMSTYLVAFMVSDYSAISVAVNNVTYRTFGRAEFINRGEGNYSLTVGPRAIAEMEAFTNITYTLDTMDQVPVPNEYYKIGAMENWGMVTYRERLLMYNAQRTTSVERQNIATIISHELAHQWFGNLVTPEWWTYIWLNEGFATYFEMFVTAQIEPTWQLMTQFVTSMVQPALQDDALESTRPMTRPAESPEQIDAQYDTIVYEKAGSVIRMAANFLGPTVFRTGLMSYLTQFSFRNAVPQNLYANWQIALGPTLNITNIMSTWELQAGYPVVTVTRNGNNVHLNQQRFLINSATTNDQALWHIPLNWMTATTNLGNILWFNTRNGTITLTGVTPAQWVIFNVNQMGFYRVNYDENNWLLISNHLRTANISVIPVINRAQLIDDAFNLARSGRLNYSIAFDIGSYIANETEYVPIVTFVRAFNHLDRLFTGRPQFNFIRNYGFTALEGYFNRTGFIQQNDDHLTRLTKMQVLSWLCRLDHGPCRNHTRQIFASWIGQSVEVQPDSQSFVYCNGIRDGTPANWQTALQRYAALREDTQRTRIAQALGCSSNQNVLQSLLAEVIRINSTFIQSDKLSAITSLYSNNGLLGVNVLLQWLIPNFSLLNERVGNVASIIRGLADRITTAEQLNLFNQFATAHRNSFTPAVNSTVNTATTTIESNLQWISDTSADINDHFAGSAAFVYIHVFLFLSCIILSLLHV